MTTISHASVALIREFARLGRSTAHIARRLGHGECTVRKYRRAEGLAGHRQAALSPLARLALVRDVTNGLPAERAAVRYGLSSAKVVHVIVCQERKQLRGVRLRGPRVWTEEPVARLVELWTNSTLGAADIAEDLNDRFGMSVTEAGVRGHARCLGLKRHPDAPGRGYRRGWRQREPSPVSITLSGGCVYRGGLVERTAA